MSLNEHVDVSRQRGGEMAQVVVVHGIGHQFEGGRLLCRDWELAVHDGLERAGHPDPESVSVECAFYGDLFRASGKAGTPLPPYSAANVDEGFEQELLLAWWEQAATVEPDRVPGPEAQTKLATPLVVQRALNALSRSRFFSGLTLRALIFDLKQVRRYIDDERIRSATQQRIIDKISVDTRVLVGHSLGSVAAYEALCAHPEWPVRALVTLGSPLGIRNLIFDRLRPSPKDGVGCWPGSVIRWVNVADRGDVVALVKQLASRFGDRVEDHQVDNGARAHDASRYLTAEETGRGIAIGLD
jgi:hypothetical protein